MTKYQVNLEDLNGFDEFYISDLRTIFRRVYSEARDVRYKHELGNAMIWKIDNNKPYKEAYILITVWNDGRITMNYKNEKFLTIREPYKEA